MTIRLMSLEADGKRREKIPRRSWTDCIRGDLTEKGLRDGDGDAAERRRWRKIIKNDDPSRSGKFQG